jgi:very-short-patch-repair endonuclease
LVIEVDGPIHDGQQDEDANRQGWIEAKGLRVLRFTNEDVLHRLDDVLAKVREATSPPAAATASSPGGKEAADEP